jgi:site-specific DNA recombinase
VQAILKQGAYTGQAHNNRTRTCHEAVGGCKKSGRGTLRRPSHEPRPSGEWIAVSVPALVSAECWQRAQERLQMNQRFSARNSKRHFYLLRSLLVCDICGRTLVGCTRDRLTVYYCSGRGKNRDPDVPLHERSISGRIVETLVWDAVCQLLRHPALLADAWQTQGEEDESQLDEGDRLTGRLRALERQWTRLLDAFQAGLLDKAELAQRKRQLEAEKEALQQRLAKLETQQRRKQITAQRMQDFEAFCHQIEASLDNPTPQVKQEVIRLLIDHVVVSKDAITIKHIIPTDDDCPLLPGRRFAQTNTDYLDFVRVRSPCSSAYPLFR